MYLKKENKKMPSRTSLSPEKKEKVLMEDALIFKFNILFY